MAAISTHPSLRMLKFERIYEEHTYEPSSSMKIYRIIAVAGMLLVNTQVDEIPSIGLTGINLSSRELSAISTGSGFLHFKRYKYHPPVIVAKVLKYN
jgi:hypothetical protein